MDKGKLREIVINRLNSGQESMLDYLIIYVVYKKNIKITLNIDFGEIALYNNFFQDLKLKVLEELEINYITDNKHYLKYY